MKKPNYKFEITRFEITRKEQQLIEFIRNEFKFGKFEVVVHAGQPQRIIQNSPPEKILG